MLSLPPRNHLISSFEKLHSHTLSHFLYHSTNSSACSAQNPSGSSRERLYIFLYSSMLLIYARLTISFDGENTRFSSIIVVIPLLFSPAIRKPPFFKLTSFLQNIVLCDLTRHYCE